MKWIVAQNACVAAGFPISRFLVQFLTPFKLAAIRLLLSGTLVGVFMYRARHTWQLPALSTWRVAGQIFTFGFFFYFVSMGCGAWALTSIPSGYASVAYNMTPFIVAVLSYWMFAERLVPLQWIGMVVGFCGLLWGLQLNQHAMFEATTLLILGLAVFGYAYGLVMLKQLTSAGVPIPVINAGGMLVGGVLAASASFFLESGAWSSGMHIWAPICIVVITSMIAGLLNARLMKKYSATTLAFGGFLIPICATLYGWIFLGEPITTQFFITLGLVAIGLYIFFIPVRAQARTSIHEIVREEQQI